MHVIASENWTWCLIKENIKKNLLYHVMLQFLCSSFGICDDDDDDDATRILFHIYNIHITSLQHEILSVKVMKKHACYLC